VRRAATWAAKGPHAPPPAAGPCTPEVWRLTGWLDALLHLSAGVVSWSSWGLDGHCGHHNAVPRARQHTLPLLAQRRDAAALSFPSTGPSAGRGPHRQDGDPGEDDALPRPDLTEPTVEGYMKTWGYQRQLLHTECTPPLHVVLIATTNLRPQARAPVVLCSSELDLAYAPRRDDDGLRCQSEGNVRDAQQDWGLEDCMHGTPTGVTKAAHRSLCMVNVAYRLRADVHARDPDDSILALQAACRGYQYVEETRKMLPEKPAPVV
jgi:hypothetical protein